MVIVAPSADDRELLISRWPMPCSPKATSLRQMASQNYDNGQQETNRADNGAFDNPVTE